MTAYERYCEIRNRLGYKDSDVVKATGVTKSTFSDWKAGKYIPKDEKMKKIADFLGVTSDYIRNGVNESVEKHEYYFDPETAKVAQEVYDNPDLRILFDAARDAKPQDIKMAADLLQRFKETNPDA